MSIVKIVLYFLKYCQNGLYSPISSNSPNKGCGNKSVYFQILSILWKYTDLLPHPLFLTNLWFRWPDSTIRGEAFKATPEEKSRFCNFLWSKWPKKFDFSQISMTTIDIQNTFPNFWCKTWIVASRAKSMQKWHYMFFRFFHDLI